MLSALSELIVPLVYFCLILLALLFLGLVFVIKKPYKFLPLLAHILFLVLIYRFYNWDEQSAKNAQLQQVGIYHLTAYPGCDSCIIELKEDKIFEVKAGDSILERADWYYKAGGDFWITYLNQGQYQLGRGKYSYKGYQLKYEKID